MAPSKRRRRRQATPMPVSIHASAWGSQALLGGRATDQAGIPPIHPLPTEGGEAVQGVRDLPGNLVQPAGGSLMRGGHQVGPLCLKPGYRLGRRGRDRLGPVACALSQQVAAPRGQNLDGGSHVIQVPGQHSPLGGIPVKVSFVGLDPLPCVQAQQVMEPVPPRGGCGFNEVGVYQLLQELLGLLTGGVGQGGRHPGSKVKLW